MSMIPLLMHSDTVSATTRDALKDIVRAPPEARREKRIAAARLLFQETDLDCGEVKDLVGLPREESCS